MGKIIKTKLLFVMLTLAALLVLIMVPRTAYAKESKLTEETLNEIRDRIDRAFNAGEAQADLTDLDIIVNMYSDRIGEQYQKVLDLCKEYAQDHGYFVLGSHREAYISPAPLTEETEECNEYGVGPNRLTAIELCYDPYYRLPDDSADLELIARTQEKLTREYECAMAVVSDNMTDAEKALALYDYIIAVSNYPDAESIDENGIETYDSESYSAISVFRDHISVCVANATAYCYLLSDCGIPCIRVDSYEMEHSWAMVQVNGEWYHADPTWDNARYMDGWTSLGDLNNDIWDLGAAGHTYFLKSDEEMVNDLMHYGWAITADFTEDCSMDEAPASGPSGSFDGTFFGSGSFWSNDVHYNYVNGSWFFLNRAANLIVKTAYGEDMDAAEYVDAPSEYMMKYVYGAGECLFICEEDGIWRYDTTSGIMEKLPLAENDRGKGQPEFTEMNIAAGMLNGVVIYRDETGESTLTEFSYPVEELLEMKVIPETEEPATEETETESETEETGASEAETTEVAATEPETEETAAAESGTEGSTADKESQEETAETEAPGTEAESEKAAEETDGNGLGVPAILLIVLAAAAVLAGVIVAVKKKQGKKQ